MKFSELFAKGIEYWPVEIDISDAHSVTNTSGFFPQLSAAWNKVECEYGDDDWEGLITWGIFGALHSLAIARWKAGIYIILKSEIDPIMAKKILSESINADNSDLTEEFQWSEEFKSLYINDLKP